MKKLKIGVICYPTVGGSGIVATELGKLLASKGHEIHFITSSVPFRLDRRYPNIYFHQVEVNQYAVFQYPPYSLALASKIAEVVKREGLDLLHAHYAIPHAVCGILAKQMTSDRIKVVTTLHGTDITVLGNDPSLQDMIKFGIEKSDLVTAVSNSLAQETSELIRPDKIIHTVYNFIDTHTYTKITETNLKEELGITPYEKVVVHVSNFRKVKRVKDVVTAFSKMVDKIPSKLLLVGDGPEMPIVCKKISELGLDDKVILLGNQEKLQEIYSICDAFMLLSEKESFGLVLLEAMACGVPCIGTNIGGIPEVITNRENGFIVELGDTDAAAERLVELFTNQELHEQFSATCHQMIAEKFDSAKITEQYEQLYYSILPSEMR